MCYHSLKNKNLLEKLLQMSTKDQINFKKFLPDPDLSDYFDFNRT